MKFGVAAEGGHGGAARAGRALGGVDVADLSD